MKITSVFEPGAAIPPRFTCDGENRNPPLFVAEVPKEAKSLVLIVDDPDAPGGTWTHWVVLNISPEIKEIQEGSVPAGALETLTSFGRSGWGGPCPPSGAHRYYFKLYALDVRSIDIPAQADTHAVRQKMNNHILAEAELMGVYARQK